MKQYLYILVAVLLISVVGANISDNNIKDLSNYGINITHFENETINTKFFKAKFDPGGVLFNESECRDICFSHTLVETQASFDRFVIAVLIAVMLTSLSLVGFFIKNENLAFYSALCSLAAYIVGALMLVI